MKDKTKYIVNSILMAAIVLVLFIMCIVTPTKDISKTERRKLKTFPKISVDTIFVKKGGSSFMDEFEIYAKDQFPIRESFRSINALAGRYVLGRQEINKLYVADGYIAKLEDGFHEADYEWSVGRIEAIIDKYADGKVYMVVIPDKNYYIAPAKHIPFLDVEAYENKLKDRLGDKIKFIDIKDKLDKSDYYYTDTHWRQEAIVDVAEYILAEVDRTANVTYSENALNNDFYGVYYGQAALPMPSEQIKYMTWDGMKDIQVYDYESGQPVPIGLYDYKAAEGMDPYEFYLYGSKSLITIENPNGQAGEAIIFRDSFGSSIAPLFAQGYQKITLVDIRYISPSMLDKFIDFKDKDIIFLYSTTVLNNSVGQFVK